MLSPGCVSLRDLRAGTSSARSTRAQSRGVASPQSKHPVGLCHQRGGDGGLQHRLLSQNTHTRVFSSSVITFLLVTPTLLLLPSLDVGELSRKNKATERWLVFPPHLRVSHFCTDGTPCVPQAHKIPFPKVAPFSPVPSAISPSRCSQKPEALTRVHLHV